MYVGRVVYILFSEGFEYSVIAAIAPSNRSALYRAVIGKVLQNPNFVPEHPISIKNYRPDIVSNEVDGIRNVRPILRGQIGGLGGPIDWMPGASQRGKKQSSQTWKSFLSEIFVGWIGKWLDLPEIGFWHEEMPDSVTNSGKRKIVMKYKPTYDDQQLEARNRKSQQLRNRRSQKVKSQDEIQSPESAPAPKKRVA
jgi:hypothetical protein